MKPYEIAREFAAGRLGRRQLLRAMTSVGITAAVFPAVMRPAAAADVDLTVFTWAEYDAATFHQLHDPSASRSGAWGHATSIAGCQGGPRTPARHGGSLQTKHGDLAASRGIPRTRQRAGQHAKFLA